MGISKLFIFVLFGTVVQISFANHQAAICVLQSSERANGDALYDVLRTVFAVIKEEAKYSLGIETKNEYSAEVIELVKQKLTADWLKVLYATLFAIQVIGSDAAADFTADLSDQKAKLDEVSENMFKAIEYSREYGGTLDQINEAGAQTIAIVIGIFEINFNLLRNSIKEQAGAIKAVDAVSLKTLADVRGFLTAVFDGAKVLYGIHASKIPVQAKDILATIDLLENFSLLQAKDGLDDKFNLLRAIVASVAADSPQILSHFTLIQDAELRLVTGWNETFSCLTDLLSTIYECEDIDLATEAIKDPMVEGLRSVYFAVIDVIEEVLSDEDSPSIIIDDGAVQEQLEKIVELIFGSIKISLSDGASEKLAEIQSNEDQVVYVISDLGADLFGKIALVTIDRVDLDVQIKNVQKLITESVENAFRAVFGLIKFIVENQNSNDEYLADRYALVIASTKLVVAYELKQEVALKFQLIRALDIRNSLYPLSATDPLDYCVDIA